MHASRERGAAAVEFALILPILMLFITSIIDGGRLWTQQAEANHVAFMAARAVSLSSSTTASSAVTTYANGVTYTVDTVNTTVCPVGSTAVAKVTITRQFTPAFTNFLIFRSRTLTAKGVAQCTG